MLLASCCPLSMKPDEVSAFSIFISFRGIFSCPLRTCWGQEDYSKPLTGTFKPQHQPLFNNRLHTFLSAEFSFFKTHQELMPHPNCTNATKTLPTHLRITFCSIKVLSDGKRLLLPLPLLSVLTSRGWEQQWRGGRLRGKWYRSWFSWYLTHLDYAPLHQPRTDRSVTSISVTSTSHLMTSVYPLLAHLAQALRRGHLWTLYDLFGTL